MGVESGKEEMLKRKSKDNPKWIIVVNAYLAFHKSRDTDYMVLSRD